MVVHIKARLLFKRLVAHCRISLKLAGGDTAKVEHRVESDTVGGNRLFLVCHKSLPLFGECRFEFRRSPQDKRHTKLVISRDWRSVKKALA